MRVATSIDGRLAFAAGDRIQFAKTDKKAGIYNGTTGTVRGIAGSRVTVEIEEGKKISFDSTDFQNFRHGCAGTIYKGQGATVDQSYLYHSEHWRASASYVGMTRHREKAELFGLWQGFVPNPHTWTASVVWRLVCRCCG